MFFFLSFFCRTRCASETDWSARRPCSNWKVAVFALYQTLIHPANPGRAPLSDSWVKPPSLRLSHSFSLLWNRYHFIRVRADVFSECCDGMAPVRAEAHTHKCIYTQGGNETNLLNFTLQWFTLCSLIRDFVSRLQRRSTTELISKDIEGREGTKWELWCRYVRGGGKKSWGFYF